MIKTIKRFIIGLQLRKIQSKYYKGEHCSDFEYNAVNFANELLRDVDFDSYEDQKLIRDAITLSYILMAERGSPESFIRKVLEISYNSGGFNQFAKK